MRRCSANDNISLIVCYEHAPFSGVRCFSPTLLRWFLRGPGIAVGGTAYSSPCSGVSPCHCPHPSLYHTICTAAEHVCLRSWALHPHLSVLVPGRTTSRAPLFGPSANRSWLNRMPTIYPSSTYTPPSFISPTRWPCKHPRRHYTSPTWRPRRKSQVRSETRGPCCSSRAELRSALYALFNPYGSM